MQFIKGNSMFEIKRIRRYRTKIPKAVDTIKRMGKGTGTIVNYKLYRDLGGLVLEFLDDTHNSSAYDPELQLKALERYAGPDYFNPDPAIFERAVGIVFSKYARKDDEEFLEPLTPDQVYDRMEMTSSSGLPFCEKKLISRQQTLSQARGIITGMNKPFPCLAFHRVQPGDAGPKQRLVWGYPAAMTVVEGIYAARLIKRFSGVDSFCLGYGLRTIGSKVLKLQQHDETVGLDYSKFDSTLHPNLIRAAFRILKTHYRKNDDLWRIIIDYFIGTPIVMPDGYVYTKRRGIPSGSYFTNLIGSLCNLILIQYASLRRDDSPVRFSRILVMGDDSLIAIDDINLDDWARFNYECGMNISKEKSSRFKFRQPVHFLGHFWKCGQPYRSLRTTAQKIIYPETHSGFLTREGNELIPLIGKLSDNPKWDDSFINALEKVSVRTRGQPLTKSNKSQYSNARIQRVTNHWVQQDFSSMHGGLDTKTIHNMLVGPTHYS